MPVVFNKPPKVEASLGMAKKKLHFLLILQGFEFVFLLCLIKQKAKDKEVSKSWFGMGKAAVMPKQRLRLCMLQMSIVRIHFLTRSLLQAVHLPKLNIIFSLTTFS